MTRRDLPGHIKKAYSSLERFMPVVDLLIELVDARMPEASRLPGLTDRLGKPTLVVLGKADLADPDVTALWLAEFQRRQMSAISLDARDVASVRALLARVEAEAQRPGLRRGTRLMVIGIPNVGKSSLINALAGRRAARVANLPGVTRNIQWIKLGTRLELLDLPGILDFALLRQGSTLRLINTLPGRDDDPIETATGLVQVMAERGLASALPDWDPAQTPDGYLEVYAHRMSLLRAGAEPDLFRAGIDLLKRFQSAGFGRISLQRPGDEPLHVGAETSADQRKPR